MQKKPPTPLTDAQKAAYQRHLKDKTFPLRVRFFAEVSLKILLCLGVLALLGYGGFSLWSLMHVKDKAGHIEQRIQQHIKDTQRESEQ
ncbi:MAG: hypothetical protein H0W78_12590 [Planctomycetes bacterium]|jgi:hypothetical protein|nr:hypothetical protein [Planctomycetota bacterium]